MADDKPRPAAVGDGSPDEHGPVHGPQRPPKAADGAGKDGPGKEGKGEAENNDEAGVKDKARSKGEASANAEAGGKRERGQDKPGDQRERLARRNVSSASTGPSTHRTRRSGWAVGRQPVTSSRLGAGTEVRSKTLLSPRSCARKRNLAATTRPNRRSGFPCRHLDRGRRKRRRREASLCWPASGWRISHWCASTPRSRSKNWPYAPSARHRLPHQREVRRAGRARTRRVSLGRARPRRDELAGGQPAAPGANLDARHQP